MPKLSEHHSQNLVKMLLIGNSGAGKTGALTSLAIAGYKLKVIDFDNGLDIMVNVLKDKKPSALDNIEFETFTDTYKPAGAQLMPVKVEAWEKGLKQIQEWTKGDQYDPDVVLVLDSLTLMSRAGFNWVMKVNNKLLGPPEIQHWGAAQNLLESLFAYLYSDALKVNIVVTSHIQYYGEGENDIKIGYPSSAVGKSFSPKIPRFFNSVLLVESQSNGKKRDIVTVPTKFIDLKNSAPTRVKERYPIETGIADYFRDVTGRTPGTPPAK